MTTQGHQINDHPRGPPRDDVDGQEGFGLLESTLPESVFHLAYGGKRPSASASISNTADRIFSLRTIQMAVNDDATCLAVPEQHTLLC